MRVYAGKCQNNDTHSHTDRHKREIKKQVVCGYVSENIENLVYITPSIDTFHDCITDLIGLYLSFGFQKAAATTVILPLTTETIRNSMFLFVPLNVVRS